MKLAQIILGFLLFATAALAADNAPLVGTWHADKKGPHGQMTNEMTFAKDGTFHGYVDINGRRFWNFAGKWTLSNGWLNYDYTKSDNPQLPAGLKDKDHVIKITATTLNLESQQGEKVTYQRK